MTSPPGAGEPGTARPVRRTRGPGPSGAMPPPRRAPEHEVTPLYGPEFVRDPYAVYERLRAYGPMAPVEVAPGVAGMLITDYRAALDLLHDPDTWSRDPRTLEQKIPDDSPIIPFAGWRPHPGANDGAVHRRYRSAVTGVFDRIAPHELRREVLEVADSLITGFGADGEAELMAQYAQDLPLVLFNRLFGMPESYGGQLVDAVGKMMEADDPEAAAAGNEACYAYIWAAVGAKKQRRGEDLTSWLLDHPAELTDEEVVAQMMAITLAGHAPLANLIGNALGRMLGDERYYSTLSAGALTPRDAIQDVLHNDPPMANFSMHWARRDVFFHGAWIQKDQLVLVSYAACNTQNGRTAPGEVSEVGRSGGGSHLAFAAGPHMCPVQNPALLVATTAIERLTAWFPDIELSVRADQLQWRNGPFTRGLAKLPARFSPIRSDQAGPTPWSPPA